ncbi:MAG: Wzz/FepE/Etk N-terminal domain-containing protein [Fusobacteriaceae bacterium]
MKQEIEKYCEREEEIDLYELLFIIFKNKKTIIITTLVVMVLSFTAALYIRANTYVKYGVKIVRDYSIENNIFLKKAKIIPERISIDTLLKNDDVIIALFKNQKLADLYHKSVSLKTDDISIMRNFILEKIKINTNKEEKLLLEERPSIEFDFLGNRNLSVEIGDLLIKLYTEEYLNKIYEKINFRYDFVSNEREKLRKDFEKVDLKIKNVMNIEFSNNYNNLNLEQIIALKYPVLFSELSNIRNLYNEYNEELIGLTGFKNDKNKKEILKKTSSYYEIKTKSKAKLILVVGIVLGLMLGITLAFIKEFVEKYKKKYG